MDALVTVRGIIARAICGDAHTVRAQLGSITLRPHQVDAVRRLQAALARSGGALLADAPGLGKTFAALAVARDYEQVLVVAPAGLRTQWTQAAQRAHIAIEWCSVETLSRRPIASTATLVIVDEAHHLRTPGTQRYLHAAALTVGKHVLLLSATPVHNRADDVDALLALFLGRMAARLSEHARAALIVQREAQRDQLPRRRRTRWLSAAAIEALGPRLRSLAPPLPAADGRQAAALVRMTLAHAWSSSVAALDAAVRRAQLRAAAIDDALSEGRWPTRRELRTWAVDSESAQLAFPLLVASPARTNLEEARATLAAHTAQLRELHQLLSGVRQVDTTDRANALCRVLDAHPQEVIIAFASYAATVQALWSALRHVPGVVALTAAGVRSAGGGLTRSDVIGALSGSTPDNPRAPLRLVLCTDLLGEGLDLRAASVVVHCDQPWTPARIAQREGRAMRLSSPHASVTVYAFRAPKGAAPLLRLARRLARKRDAMRRVSASGAQREVLRRRVDGWCHAPIGAARVAAVLSATPGWIAVVHDGITSRVIAALDGAPPACEDAVLLRATAALIRPVRAPVDPHTVGVARRAVFHWIRKARGRELANEPAASVAVADSARRAVMRRLDRAVRAAPLHQRAAMHERVAALRALIAGARGAGAEQIMREAAKCADTARLFARLKDVAASRTVTGVRRRAHIVAMLLLVP